MHQIILLGTSHKRNKRCSPEALYRLVDQISPDVIFEEVPPSKHKGIYSGELSDSLETVTIKEYLKNHDIQNIPVDLDFPHKEETWIKSNVMELDGLFQMHSTEYSQLRQFNRFHSSQFGFSYLNSNDFLSVSERLLALEIKMIKQFNDSRLTDIHSKWLDFINKRESKMISTIEEYSGKNDFKMGLFLVGSQHRMSLINRINNKKSMDSSIKWNLNYMDRFIE